MNKIFIDCNIILDWVFDRLPFSIYAVKLITLIENKKITAFTTPLILSNTYYIIQKKKNRKVADNFLKDCKKVFKILDLTEHITLKAIDNRFVDFEDDVHYYSALSNNIEYIITRDKSHFESKNILILTAEEYLILINEI
ncbi:MAG: hypothetical protein A2096_09950 [Spirochaetes bacterium GWF1_41_5]|nr:MAG: hypothetical protein A2096_09950 [Spirochaetes bacterium GWF1_41_5]HBE03975.1 PIN domain nuclease [Spirochaetia bacterium]